MQLSMKPLQTAAILVILLILGHAILTEYFVKPNESTRCPALPCHTLSYYLGNTTRYFTSTTRISFLNGVHDINKSGVLLIKKVFNLTLAGYNVSGSNTAKITCLQPAILRFNKITNLVINHLSVLSSPLLCGCYVIECIIFQIKPCNLCPVGIKYR